MPRRPTPPRPQTPPQIWLPQAFPPPRPGQWIRPLTTKEGRTLLGGFFVIGVVFWSVMFAWSLRTNTGASITSTPSTPSSTIPAKPKPPADRKPTVAEQQLLGMWRGTFSDGTHGHYLFVWVENAPNSYLGYADNSDGSLVPKWRELKEWKMPHKEWTEWIYGSFGSRALVTKINDATMIKTCNPRTICKKKRFDAGYIYGWNDNDHAEVLAFTGENAVIESRQLPMFTHTRERWH